MRVPSWATTMTMLPIAAFAVSLVSATVSFFQLRNGNRAILVSNRAWVAPSHPQLATPFENASAEPLIAVEIQNTGPTPALDVSGNMMPFSLPIEIPKNARDYPATAFWQIADKQKEACDTKEAVRGHKPLYRVGDLGDDMQSEIIDGYDRAALLSGQQTLVVFGCVAYRTMGEVHRASFCYYLNPRLGRKSDQWTFKDCPTGNAAD